MYHVQGVEILQLLGVAWPQIDPNDTERDYPRRAAIVNLLVDDHTYLDVGFSLYLSYLALLVESLFLWKIGRAGWHSLGRSRVRCYGKGE